MSTCSQCSPVSWFDLSAAWCGTAIRERNPSSVAADLFVSKRFTVKSIGQGRPRDSGTPDQRQKATRKGTCLLRVHTMVAKASRIDGLLFNKVNCPKVDKSWAQLEAIKGDSVLSQLPALSKDPIFLLYLEESMYGYSSNMPLFFRLSYMSSIHTFRRSGLMTECCYSHFAKKPHWSCTCYLLWKGLTGKMPQVIPILAAAEVAVFRQNRGIPGRRSPRRGHHGEVTMVFEYTSWVLGWDALGWKCSCDLHMNIQMQQRSQSWFCHLSLWSIEIHSTSGLVTGNKRAKVKRKEWKVFNIARWTWACELEEWPTLQKSCVKTGRNSLWERHGLSPCRA